MAWSNDRKPIEDYEYPEPDEDDDSYDDVDCPECGASVYEDIEQCPHCGSYITHSTNVWSGRPAWWIILGAIGVAVTMLALLSQ